MLKNVHWIECGGAYKFILYKYWIEDYNVVIKTTWCDSRVEK